MVFLKNKAFVYIFRILIILTFIGGMLYLIAFVRLAQTSVSVSESSFLSACSRWTYYFFVYLGLAAAALLMSVIDLLKLPKPLPVIRTAVLAFCTLSDILAFRYVRVFRSYDDAVEAAKAIDGLLDKGTTFIILSFVGAMLTFFLMVASIAALIRYVPEEPDKKKKTKAK